MDEDNIEKTYSIVQFRRLQKEFPHLNILVGAMTRRSFESGEKITSTARVKNKGGVDVFYEVYNSVIFIPNNGDVKIYHKSKLVPGAENMPFPAILDPLAELIVDIGGVSGSLGSYNTLNHFSMKGNVISPLICYESVYGDMSLGETNILAVVTNDGWWKNTPGYRQHFSYSKLRAVEQRKIVVRSANTGISGVINSRGDVLKQSNWDEEVCLTSKVRLNNTVTFYSEFGDYIGRVSVFVFSILMMVLFVRRFLLRK